MSIFNRLKDILRSNIHAARNSGPASRIFGNEEPDPLADAAYEEAFRDSAYADQGYGDRGFSPNDEPARDPEAAQWYADLNVAYGSDLDTVKAAWKSLIKKHHPDLFHNDPAGKKKAEERSRAINMAYRELEKRLSKKQ